MRQRRLMNQINVVPYIDVMLVLLVIFMVTAPMIQQGTINVPSAGAGTPRVSAMSRCFTSAAMLGGRWWNIVRCAARTLRSGGKCAARC